MTDFRTVRPSDAEWPSGLNELPGETPVTSLNCRGLCLPPDHDKVVAIVGTRHPTAAGIEAASSISKGLAEAGFVIASGLARGIDTAAHVAALNAGSTTVAVLGCGFDIDYPSRSRRLRERIVEQGTLVSEYEPTDQPHPHHFPQRNRIIVGLANHVVVVEGGLRSGALITARIAVDTGRNVFAVPGSVRNAASMGSNELIRTSQAALATSAEHILEEIAPKLVWREPVDVALPIPPPMEEDDARVLCFMDDSPTPPDRICEQLGVAPGALAIALARLEVRGYITKRMTGHEITTAGARTRAALLAVNP